MILAFQGCHFRRLSGKSRLKDIVRTSVRLDERPSRPTAGGRHGQTAGWSALADSRPLWPWRTAMVDEEVKNLEEKALHLL
jgi:hypothetical protein